MKEPSAFPTTEPPLFANRWLDRLGRYCLRGLIQRIARHYQQQTEQLQQHLHAVEAGTEDVVLQYQQQVYDLRQVLQQQRESAHQADPSAETILQERIVALTEELHHVRQNQAAAESRLRQAQTQEQLQSSQQQRLQREIQTLQQHLQRSENAQGRYRTKINELVSAADKFRNDKATAVQQLDQQRREYSGQLRALRRELSQRELELQTVRTQLERAEQCLQQRPVVDSMAASIPSTMLRRLVQLCHPDKHNNNEASLEATRWLNRLRHEAGRQRHEQDSPVY